MKSYCFKLLLLIAVLVMSGTNSFAQYSWEKHPGNPLNIHGTSGTWDESVIGSCVIFNSDLNRYEMWYTSYTGSLPNNGIGFAWSADGITWTKHPTAVLTPSPSSWDYPFVGAACVLKEGGTYKMWYTGGQSGNLSSSHIGYATSTDGGITWQKDMVNNPVLNPGTGWESGAVGYPSVIKISDTYYMFYSGAVTVGIARTGRAISSDGIIWQKDTTHNPVLPAGGPGEWDRNNYLGKVIELNNTLYIYYTAESNPGVGGSAIGGAVSTDLGISWTKFENNPILPQGASGQWDYGWIEGPCPVFAQNELKLYYDGGGAATNWLGRIGLAISDPLPAGTYTIGTVGNFATIQDAFDKLDTDGIAGPITLELIDDLYTAPTGQVGFLLFGPIPGSGPSSRVTIKPAANKNVIIEGNNQVIIDLYNTSYTTIDGIGLSGSTTLTVHVYHNAQYQWNSGMGFYNDCDHNIIQNITFISDDYTRSGSGLEIYTPPGYTATCDSNLIQYNFIPRGGWAMYLSANNSSSRATGNIIRGNQIGSETDSLIAWGIQVEHCQNTIVEDNIVQNLKITPNFGEIVNMGINSWRGSGVIIRNNVVHGIKSNAGYMSVGILLSGADGTNSQIYNNMIYDIQSSSTSFDSRVSGIQMFYQSNPKVYYNTVYLSGTGANKSGSAALYIYDGITNADIKNNIFVNTRDEGQYCASAIYDYGSTNLTSDYNDLYYESNQYNCLVRAGGTDYFTLADWQVTGKDLNSLNEIVNFTLPDLHINPNINTILDGHATPITGIDTDIDGDTRNATIPDIGADEFELNPNATNWQMQNSGLPADVMIVDFSAVNNLVCWAVAQKYPNNTVPYPGYIRTTDGGVNWILNTIPGIPDGYFQQIFAIDADTAYATVYVQSGESSKGIYKTTDAGATWNRQNAYNTSLYGPGYIHFFDEQNGVVIGDPNIETYTTSNGGLTWIPVSMPAALPDELTYLNGTAITAVGSTIWFGTGARLYKSTNKGYTWTILISEPENLIWNPSIAFQDSLIGIYSLKKRGDFTDHLYRKTTDGGENWNTLSNSILDNIAPTSIQKIRGTASTYVLSGGRNPGMKGTAVTYDAGESWSLVDNVGNLHIIFPSNTVGWGSQYSSNVVNKYVGPRIITTVEEEIIDIIPTGYSLSQNYPNPFNPSTTFRYSIPQTSKVVIKVYDILGNEIATLMDEEKSVGTYELTWNAENLPSGVYFYQLKAGDFIQTKKMILLK